jgi:NAD(P)-dependent dehydrogenase (short-subunit alcohol dehydrogenase family)
MSARLVIVTGGGRGIGRATCRRFAAAGDQVVAVARTAAEIEETRDQIQADGGVCAACSADLGRCEEVERLIDSVHREFGRVDVLVNNAGMVVKGPAATMDPAAFEAMVAVNISAIFHATRRVWPIMEAQGGGTIINVSSMAAFDPFPGLGTYGATKAWVNTFTLGLAGEGRKAGIRVFGVAPGSVETKMLRSIFPDLPAHRVLSPDQLADTIFAVARPEFAHATGQVIAVRS